MQHINYVRIIEKLSLKNWVKFEFWSTLLRDAQGSKTDHDSGMEMLGVQLRKY